jgi:hypothetical protein
MIAVPSSNTADRYEEVEVAVVVAAVVAQFTDFGREAHGY